jgi:SAM-dependent methyltransferase
MTPTSNLDELLAALAEFGVAIRGAAIADVGCGDGAFTRGLARAGARPTGIEVSSAQLARVEAAARIGDERYAVGAGDALPFAAKSLDAIVYCKSFHHVPVVAMPAALAEAARALRPGGLLIVIEPLAQGAYFELVKPLDDESAVRAAALSALAEPPAALCPLAERDYLVVNRFDGFESVVAALVAPDPERRRALPAAEPAMREAFARLGRRDGEAFVFDQPTRLFAFAADGG